MPRTFTNRRFCLATATVLSLGLPVSGGLHAQSNAADFDQIIEVPPSNIEDGANFESLRDQINVREGGSVGRGVTIDFDDELNVFGGTIGRDFNLNGGLANVFGGTVEDSFVINNFGRATVSGGTVGTVGVRSGLLAIEGGEVSRGDGFGFGAGVEVTGGTVGSVSGGAGAFLTVDAGFVEDISLTDASAVINGGEVSTASVFRGALELNGGSVIELDAIVDSVITVTGGTISTLNTFGFPDNLVVVTITGGTTTALDVSDGSVVIRGGNHFGGEVSLDSGRLSLFGDDFAIDGTPLNVAAGAAFTVVDRDVDLTGTFEDGSFFSLNLDQSGANGGGGVRSDFQVVLNGVPEPSVAFLVGAGGLLMGFRRRVK